MGSRRSKFSELEDLIQQDQGEVGLTLEYNEETGEMCFTHMVMAEKEKFKKTELQVVYVQMLLQEHKAETEDEKLASVRFQNYLQTV